MRYGKVLMSVLFLCACGLQSADTSPQITIVHEIKPTAKRKTAHKKISPLTENNFSFSYNDRAVMPNKMTVQKIKYSVRKFSRMTKNVERFFQNDNNLEGMNEHAIDAWGGLYSLRPELAENKITVDEYSTPYILSLIFLGKYEQAQTNALVLLKKTPDHYGALLLLGMLSMYNRENFPYLERAFVMNPFKTLYFFDWHFSYIMFYPQDDWDFVDAFFKMLTKHRSLLVDLKIPPNLVSRLSKAFILKYEEPQRNEPNEPKYRICSEMYGMIQLIRRHYQYVPKKKTVKTD